MGITERKYKNPDFSRLIVIKKQFIIKSILD